MKSNLVKSAVAAALALGAANAMALTPAEIQAALSAGTLKTLYISGATSSDNSLKGLVTTAGAGLFAETSDGSGDGHLADLYNITASAAGGGAKNFVLTGRLASAAGSLPAGTLVAIVKDTSGSAIGINPVVAGSSIEFPNLSGITAANFPSLTGHVSAAVTASAANGLIGAVAPDAGMSDAEPSAFVGVDLSGAVGGNVTAATVAKLNSTGAFAVPFAPIVSVPLYRALQAAEGLTADDHLANVPSLSSAQLAALFGGVKTAGASGTLRVNGVTLASPSSGDNIIHIVRRGNDSGTQLGFGVQFFNFNIVKGTNTGFPVPSGGTPVSNLYTGTAWADATYGVGNGPNIFAAKGSGDVRAALNWFSGAGHYAIGIHSTDTKPSNTPADALQFRFIKVDGVAPSLVNLANGTYPFFLQNTLNVPNGTTHDLAGDKLALWGAFSGAVNSQTVLTKVNQGFRNSLAIDEADRGGDADTGLMDIPGTTATTRPTMPVTGTSVRAAAINGQTRTNAQARPLALTGTFGVTP